MILSFQDFKQEKSDKTRYVILLEFMINSKHILLGVPLLFGLP